MKPAIAALALALPFLGTAAYAAPLVSNGDFSSSSYGTSSSQFGTGYGGQGVTGWTGNGGYNIYFQAGTATSVGANSQYGGGLEKLWAVKTSPTGGNFVALDGDMGVQGGISQTISGLIAGNVYALTFSWGAGQLQSRTGATTESLVASLGSQSFTTSVVSNPSEGFTGWFTQTFDYTATAATETLSFLSVGSPRGLPPIATLDGVSLTPVTAVPEPASLTIFGAALAGLCFVRRRNKKTV